MINEYFAYNQHPSSLHYAVTDWNIELLLQKYKISAQFFIELFVISRRANTGFPIKLGMTTISFEFSSLNNSRVQKNNNELFNSSFLLSFAKICVNSWFKILYS
jgi:hypothetical protein